MGAGTSVGVGVGVGEVRVRVVVEVLRVRRVSGFGNTDVSEDPPTYPHSPLSLSRSFSLFLSQRRASHLFWGLWGILQARERGNQVPKEGEFDYAAYAANRIDALVSLSRQTPNP